MALFGTAGIRGPVEEAVTPSLALAVGQAAGRDGTKWVVGRDGRPSGPALSDAVAAGLTSVGADVIRIGAVPTPALAFASRGRRGIMITASHNPPADNGIKLFSNGIEYDSTAEQRIEDRIESGSSPTDWTSWGSTNRSSILPDYRRAVVEYAQSITPNLAGLEIAIDTGGGMGVLSTPHVLRDLGAHVHAIHADIDGLFRGRSSKPTETALTNLRNFVDDSPTIAFGIAHDGDGDRIVIVDDSGEVIHEDTVLAIIAEHYIRSSDVEEPVVVTTPNASARIDDRVLAAGGTVERVNLGSLHEGIKRVAKFGSENARVVFAAEPWKHIHPEFGRWIDATVTAAVFAGLVAEDGLSSLRAPIRERPYQKMSIPCPDGAKAVVIDQLTGELANRYPESTIDTTYGIRLDWEDGSWVLIRPSGTEPRIRIYSEGETVEHRTEEIRKLVESAVPASD